MRQSTTFQVHRTLAGSSIMVSVPQRKTIHHHYPHTSPVPHHHKHVDSSATQLSYQMTPKSLRNFLILQL